MNPKPLKISFEEAEFIWSQKLWPQRNSPIEPISWIDSSGNIDMSLKLGNPSFWGLFENSEIKGVVSGFSTSTKMYRSRGLWVDESLRMKGWGKVLMAQVEEQASVENCTVLWTMPRLTAWPFYAAAGFRQMGLTEKYEFGPHVLAEKDVSCHPKSSNLTSF